MKRTIHFSDDLAERMQQYLGKHPEETWSGLVQKAVNHELRRKDTAKLKNLIGILEGAPTDLSTNEDQYH